jgi:hypothetical protein
VQISASEHCADSSSFKGNSANCHYPSCNVLIPALLPPFERLSLHQNEVTENVSLCVENECQSVHATVIIAMEFLVTEITTVDLTQQFEAFHVELIK